MAGWGETFDCSNVLRGSRVDRTTGNPLPERPFLDSTKLFPTYDAAQIALGDNIVPYVVDFSWRIQHPIPRPFYCSRLFPPQNDDYLAVDISGTFGSVYWSAFDLVHSWYFFTLPDEVVIDSNLIYVDSEWNWTDQDGLVQIP